MRSFAIRELDAISLNECFPDILRYTDACEYRECRHVEEPVCGVKEAVTRGDLPEYRYKSYLAVLLGASGVKPKQVLKVKFKKGLEIP